MSDGGADADFDSDSNGATLAGASDGIPDGVPAVQAFALTRDFADNQPELESCAIIWPPRVNPCNPENGIDLNVVTWTVAAVAKTYQFYSFSCEDISADIDGTFTADAPESGRSALATVIVPTSGTGLRSTPAVFGVIQTCESHELPVSTSLNGAGTRWEHSSVLPMPSEGGDIQVVNVGFSEEIETGSGLDLDGDGRFTAADYDELSLLLNTSSAGYEHFDFDESGMLDSFDATVVDALLDNGFGVYRLGDLNEDGDVTCEDVEEIASFPSGTLGGLGYLSGADADLDGDNDLDDREHVEAVLAAVWPAGDVNGDALVDILDYLDFMDAFGTCENLPGPCYASGGTVNADFNGDTTVDILDFLDFTDAYGNPCP